MADDQPCFSRRRFLLGSGSTMVTILLSSLPGMAHAKGVLKLRRTGYPRTKIGRISLLEKGRPVFFKYPGQHAHCAFMLVRLGREAAGGVGPDQDIVAFSRLCAHMGAPLDGFREEHSTLGPCAEHLTVFDLRRHGMVVSGHATETLPQAVLETDGDDIYAVGVLGLIYGFHDNQDAL